MSDYLIIGGTGSLGQKLIERLLPSHTVTVYSRDEAKHWTIRNALGCGALALRAQNNLQFYVGDVRDAGRLRAVFRRDAPRAILVASALKQVDTCEISPDESVRTNLEGVQNVVDAVNDGSGLAELRHVLLVSTDKACAPVNVYGMCKAIAERIVTSQARAGRGYVQFLAVRYGNVLESRGSIIPLFRYQADHADALTVTDPDMTRFVMTLSESADLIQHTLRYGTSGETWIPQLPAMRIGDLAELFAERAQKPIRIIGLRPGEKMHEDLINASESPRARVERAHYVIGPSFAPLSGTRFTYTSADRVMTKRDLAQLLLRLGVLDLPMEKFVGRTIEEIRVNGPGGAGQ